MHRRFLEARHTARKPGFSRQFSRLAVLCLLSAALPTIAPLGHLVRAQALEPVAEPVEIQSSEFSIVSPVARNGDPTAPGARSAQSWAWTATVAGPVRLSASSTLGQAWMAVFREDGGSLHLLGMKDYEPLSRASVVTIDAEIEKNYRILVSPESLSGLLHVRGLQTGRDSIYASRFDSVESGTGTLIGNHGWQGLNAEECSGVATTRGIPTAFLTTQGATGRTASLWLPVNYAPLQKRDATARIDLEWCVEHAADSGKVSYHLLVYNDEGDFLRGIEFEGHTGRIWTCDASGRYPTAAKFSPNRIYRLEAIFDSELSEWSAEIDDLEFARRRIETSHGPRSTLGSIALAWTREYPASRVSSTLRFADLRISRSASRVDSDTLSKPVADNAAQTAPVAPTGIESPMVRLAKNAMSGGKDFVFSSVPHASLALAQRNVVSSIDAKATVRIEPAIEKTTYVKVYADNAPMAQFSNGRAQDIAWNNPLPGVRTVSVNAIDRDSAFVSNTIWALIPTPAQSIALPGAPRDPGWQQPSGDPPSRIVQIDLEALDGALAAMIDEHTASLGADQRQASVIRTFSLSIPNESDRDQAIPRQAARSVSLVFGTVGVGSKALPLEFNIPERGPALALLRGSGPYLGRLGVSGFVADPALQLSRRKGPGTIGRIADNDDWTATPDSAAMVAGLANALGLLPFQTGSTDCALVLTLEPGDYTAALTAGNGPVAEGLLEVYIVY